MPRNPCAPPREAGLAAFEVRAFDWIELELERVATLGIGMSVGRGFEFGQPSTDSAGGCLTRHEPGLAVIASAGAGKACTELVDGHQIEREGDGVAGLGTIIDLICH
jgi:hypothetical protein